jgi:hypothetical protein
MHPGVNAGSIMVSMKDKTQKINQSSLDEIIRRIVAVAAPDRIILFGSAARAAKWVRTATRIYS